MAEKTIESLEAELASAQARIKELNGESAGHRINWQNAQKELEKVTKDFETERATLTEKVTKAEQSVTEAAGKIKQTQLDAALKIAAKEAGIRDLDGLKLLDTSKIEIADDGSVKIPEKYWEDAKKAKPYLFGEATTSQTQKAPEPGGKPESVVNLKPEDYDAARAAYLRS